MADTSDVLALFQSVLTAASTDETMKARLKEILDEEAELETMREDIIAKQNEWQVFAAEQLELKAQNEKDALRNARQEEKIARAQEILTRDQARMEKKLARMSAIWTDEDETPAAE